MNKLASIHPDHLLDLARRGTLPPGERQRLGAHLAVCQPCAWEQAATDDFERERGAMEIDPAQLDRLVGGALSRWGRERPQTPGSCGALSRAGLAPSPTLVTVARPGLRPRVQASGPRWGLAAAAVLAAAIGAAMTLPARSPLEGARIDPPVASTEAGLDAGALSAGVGGDS